MNIVSIYEMFPNEEACITYLEKVRWGGKPVCVYCGAEHKTGKQQADKRYMCFSCKRNYHVCVGTIFHGTQMPLQKWFIVLSLVLNAKKGISSCQLARDCGLTQRTAWYMVVRIRKAMESEEGKLLQGIVEMDETYIGGKPRKENIQKTEYEKETHNKRGRGTKKKQVIGIVQRKGEVRTEATEDTSRTNISTLIGKYVSWQNSILMTDEARHYNAVGGYMEHKVIKHKERFARGSVHTNTIENFWSIVKRGIEGIYQHVSQKYLDSYLLEFSYKYNNRQIDSKTLFFNTLNRMV